MSATVNKDDEGWPKSIIITCDVCEASHSEQEIIAGDGLLKMGWSIRNGEHLCPKHAPKEK